eukprot:1806377-Pleurochrysis_carterae.AAC.1
MPDCPRLRVCISPRERGHGCARARVRERARMRVRVRHLLLAYICMVVHMNRQTSSNSANEHVWSHRANLVERHAFSFNTRAFRQKRATLAEDREARTLACANCSSAVSSAETGTYHTSPENLAGAPAAFAEVSEFDEFAELVVFVVRLATSSS